MRACLPRRLCSCLVRPGWLQRSPTHSTLAAAQWHVKGVLAVAAGRRATCTCVSGLSLVLGSLQAGGPHLAPEDPCNRQQLCVWVVCTCELPLAASQGMHVCLCASWLTAPLRCRASGMCWPRVCCMDRKKAHGLHVCVSRNTCRHSSSTAVQQGSERAAPLLCCSAAPQLGAGRPATARSHPPAPLCVAPAVVCGLHPQSCACDGRWRLLCAQRVREWACCLFACVHRRTQPWHCELHVHLGVMLHAARMCECVVMRMWLLGDAASHALCEVRAERQGASKLATASMSRAVAACAAVCTIRVLCHGGGQGPCIDQPMCASMRAAVAPDSP